MRPLYKPEDEQMLAPWTVGLVNVPSDPMHSHGIRDSENWVIAEIVCDQIPPKRCEALANLIAAAPELLSALEYMVAFHTPGEIPERFGVGQMQERMAQARAAIRKANGEEPRGPHEDEQ